MTLRPLKSKYKFHYWEMKSLDAKQATLLKQNHELKKESRPIRSIRESDLVLPFFGATLKTFIPLVAYVGGAVSVDRVVGVDGCFCR